MADDTKFKSRVLASGVEKIAPKPAEEKGAEEPRGGNWFVRKMGPLVAGLALVCAPAANTGCTDSAPPVEDADVDAGHDVEADVGDSDVAEADVPDVDAIEDDGGEVDGLDALDADVAEGDSDSEVAEACPVLEDERVVVESPGPIGEIGQTITEIYESVRECDGSMSRGALREIEIMLDTPASMEQLEDAVKMGSSTIIDGVLMRWVYIGPATVGFAEYVAGPNSQRLDAGRGQGVDDGIHSATVRHFMPDYVGVLKTQVGEGTSEEVIFEGRYGLFPDGKAVMVTNFNFSTMDPLSSTCDLALLKAPEHVEDGGTVRGFRVSIEGDGMNVSAIRFTVE